MKTCYSTHLILSLIMVGVFMMGCNDTSETDSESTTPTVTTRAESIPDDAVKVTAETDVHQPILHSTFWEAPVPLGEPVNTAGAEDSAFVTPDGNSLYFFFTPDVTVPAEKQLLDGVTGTWWSEKKNGRWQEPQRIVLSDDLCLDGAVFIQGDTMWFASVRQGNYREADIYTATFKNGQWTDVTNAGQQLNQVYQVGELHITSDGQTMYCGGPEKWGDFTGKDLYVLHKQGNGWSEPVALTTPVNTTTYNEDQPFVTEDGQELWFTGQSRFGYAGPAVFRSFKIGDNQWSNPEEIISNFAAEPTLDNKGNLYFIHHYYNSDMQMVEADIYVAYSK